MIPPKEQEVLRIFQELCPYQVHDPCIGEIGSLQLGVEFGGSVFPLVVNIPTNDTMSAEALARRLYDYTESMLNYTSILSPQESVGRCGPNNKVFALCGRIIEAFSSICQYKIIEAKVSANGAIDVSVNVGHNDVVSCYLNLDMLGTNWTTAKIFEAASDIYQYIEERKRELADDQK